MGDSTKDFNDEVTRLHNVPQTASRDWRFFNVIVLGFSFLLVFTAFQTCSMVETLVLEGAKHDRNDTDDTYVGKGYTSLSIVYGVFAASNWIAPSIVAVLRPKWSMILGAALYSIFIGFFLRPMAVTLYIASALVGVGAAVLWAAQGNFLTINSTTETMTRNTGIFWALLQGSLLFGNLFVYFSFRDITFIPEHTRTLLFIVLTSVSAAGTLLMITFRQQQPSDTEIDGRLGPLEAFKRSCRLLGTKQMLLLCICFAYTGLEQSFWSAVFITSVGHTTDFKTDAKRLAGLCGMAVGVGEIVSGILFGFLGNCASARRPSRDSVVFTGYIAHIVCYFLVFIMFPADSPLHESELSSFFTPSFAVAILCGFLLGFGDGTLNTQIYPVVAALFPSDSTSAFALFKFVQSLASAATFVYSQHLFLHWQLLILVTFGSAGTLLFFVAEHLAESRSITAGYIAIQSST
jgi:hypothetical protein